MKMENFCYSPNIIFICHSELVEESPSYTTHFVREPVLSHNLIVSVNALLLSFQILRSLCSLRMTESEYLRMTRENGFN
ncbi:MAG: hypothetical protein ACI4HZ_01455 [Ruminococcus sp.]